MKTCSRWGVGINHCSLDKVFTKLLPIRSRQIDAASVFRRRTVAWRHWKGQRTLHSIPWMLLTHSISTSCRSSACTSVVCVQAAPTLRQLRRSFVLASRRVLSCDTQVRTAMVRFEERVFLLLRDFIEIGQKTPDVLTTIMQIVHIQEQVDENNHGVHRTKLLRNDKGV